MMLVPSSIFKTPSESFNVKKIALLGATGSIGDTTLELIRRFPENFSLHSISAHTQIDKLKSIINEFNPKHAVISGVHSSDIGASYNGTIISYGDDSINEIASDPEVNIVVAGIVGIAGLSSALAALNSGKRVALANKESIVCGALLLENAIKNGKGSIIPIDSEHASLFQCLEGRYFDEVKRLILTASGGPFLNKKREELGDITPAQAAAHPKWSMGQKVSIDSATLCNKALELFEANFLFGGIHTDIVIHPESFIHGAVELIDGSIMVHAGYPHMAAPIGFGLSYPERLPDLIPSPSHFAPPSISLLPVDQSRFPAIRLAYQALEGGAGMTLVFNAANESAVSAFVRGKITFLEIESSIEEALAKFSGASYTSLSDVMDLNNEVHRYLESMRNR